MIMIIRTIYVKSYNDRYMKTYLLPKFGKIGSEDVITPPRQPNPE